MIEEMADTNIYTLSGKIAAGIALAGLLSQAVEIADLCSSWMKWHGPVRSIVDAWHNSVVVPFHGFCQTLFECLASPFHVRSASLPTLVTDYLVIGLLFSISLLALSPSTLTSDGARDDRSKPRAIINLLSFSVLWPLELFIAVGGGLKMIYAYHAFAGSNLVWDQEYIDRIKLVLMPPALLIGLAIVNSIVP